MHPFTEHWATFVSQHRPGIVEFWVSLIVQITAFWLPASAYLALDLYLPAFSRAHKLQSAQRQPTWPEIRECVQHVARNTLGSSIAHLAVLRLSGFETSLFSVAATPPPAQTLAADFAYALLAREALFYYAHRALHAPPLYRRVHKQHHRFTAPMAFAAQYAHPLEHVLANTLPVVLPLALRRAHILSFALFLAYELWETASVHSGYDFVAWPLPLSPARVHDLHHEKFVVNFGSIGLMDWIHGTGPGDAVTKSGKTKVKAG